MLDATRISSLQPAAKPYKRFDSHGLYLLVSPCGGKWWRVRYRHGGKHKTLSVGVFPHVSIEQARAQRDEIRALLAKNIDPSTLRRDDKARQRAIVLESKIPLPIRVTASIDGTVEIWKGQSVVRLTQHEACITRDLLNRITA